MEFIFSLNDSNLEGYFIERGAFIHDGKMGLYFGLITEEQIPKSLSKLSNVYASSHSLPGQPFGLVDKKTLAAITMQVLVKIKNYEVHNAKTNYIG